MATEGVSPIHADHELITSQEEFLEGFQKWLDLDAGRNNRLLGGSQKKNVSLTDLESRLSTARNKREKYGRIGTLPDEKTSLASRHQQNMERREGYSLDEIKKITKECFELLNRGLGKNHDKKFLFDAAKILSQSDVSVEKEVKEREDCSEKVKKISKAFLELFDDQHMKNVDKTFLYDFAKRIMSESDVSVQKKAKENELLNPLLPESSRAQQRDIAVTITPTESTETIQQRNEAKSWKILQCVVVGGLFESITSLVIVTSAATSNIISNGNILALALANLISGFFLIRHDLSITRKEQKLKQGNEMLRAAVHYSFHFTVAIISFILFGAVPPFVYAFTIGDKNLKLAIAAGVSLSCIALLAALKAHLQKLKHQAVISYIKTVASFMVFGVAAFVLSYLAGSLFGKLIEKVDWFE
ncbi:membrane protein of ER body 1-like [Momordica charantia]|uniref:Membrane protein of ER body 1-like n=1 Tax=Momordica charantia TaxID=3673 RepID=A0A6J1DDW9_MOMCH|nr:membrane protein of ER body 1-like [Momordica charantia]